MAGQDVDAGVTPAQRWVLLLSGIGSFMVILDLMAVSTALPNIRSDLRASVSDLEWTINAYTLTFAVLLMTAAALGERWGRRRTYSAGLLLFAGSSAACALAPSIATLIAARAVQGVGAAVVMPLALGLLNSAFPAERRGWALGVYGSITGLAALLGPVLGGVVTQGLAWRWIFWINVPIGAAAAAAVLVKIRETRGTPRPLDPIGIVLVTAAALGVVWGLVRSGAAGWGSGVVVAAIAAGAVSFAALLTWERRARHPMIPLRLFASRGFSAANAGIFLLNGAMTAAIFFTAQFLQTSQHLDPLAAGLRLLPWGVAPLLLGAWSGRRADRIGERPLVAGGMALQTIGLLGLAVLATPDRGYLALVGPMLVVGIGFSLAVPPMTKAVTGSVATGDIGTASGIFSTLRQLGGAFGVTIASTVFTATGSYRSSATFADGYRGAAYLAATLALFGVGCALALPPRPATTVPVAVPVAAQRRSSIPDCRPSPGGTVPRRVGMTLTPDGRCSQ